MQSLTIETPDGIGEATKEGQDRPWEVNLPSTSFKFYGSVSQVTAEIKKALKRLDQEELLNTQPRTTHTNKNFLAEAIARLMEEYGYYVEDLYYIHNLLGKHTQVTKNYTITKKK
tara:strand:+ start:194 stop:538 length:345 start_codon:yes stop_codon:yes gene_type:complete